jgi:hypothetical protein
VTARLQALHVVHADSKRLSKRGLRESGGMTELSDATPNVRLQLTEVATAHPALLERVRSQ